ncbi:MAG TPA: hypothetical protein VI504_11170 [Candidatus Eisenbacteria bacterium]|jgi:hypothetical protein
MHEPLRTSPVPRWRRPFLTLLALAWISAAAVARAASCPENQIVLTGASVVSGQPALDLLGLNSHGSYDLKKGQLASNVSFNEPGFAVSSVATEDEYWVVGLPAGTPLDFTAGLAISGSWNVFPGVPQGDFTCAASIATDSDSAGFAIPNGSCCHGSISQPLAIPVHALASAHFRLRLRLASQDYRGRVDLAGLLSFTGVPAGVAVVSCQGYTSDVTDVRRSTWGRLKSIYR